MKKTTSNFTCYMVALFFLMATSCKEKTKEERELPLPKNEIKTGTLKAHIHTFVSEEEVFSYNTNLILPDNREISVSLAQLYISNIELMISDSTSYLLPDTIVLQVQEKNTYTFGQVPAGNYKGIKFLVGFDAKTNKKIPSTLPSDPLNTPNMWFSNTAQNGGYVFLHFQGKIDTTHDASGAFPMQNFSYKIGGENNFYKVTLANHPFTIQGDGTEYLHLITDYYQLLRNIKLSDPNNLSVLSPENNSTEIAGKIRNNIQYLFKYEL